MADNKTVVALVPISGGLVIAIIVIMLIFAPELFIYGVIIAGILIVASLGAVFAFSDRGTDGTHQQFHASCPSGENPKTTFFENGQVKSMECVSPSEENKPIVPITPRKSRKYEE